jgi:hypothetical protein
MGRGRRTARRGVFVASVAHGAGRRKPCLSGTESFIIVLLRGGSDRDVACHPLVHGAVHVYSR